MNNSTMIQDFNTYDKQKKALATTVGSVALVTATTIPVQAQTATDTDAITRLTAIATAAGSIIDVLLNIALIILAFQYGRSMMRKVR